MLKRIAPKATKGKGRSWKAHQSGSSNPETNTFRAKARLMRLRNLAVQAGNSTVAIDFKSMSLTDRSKSGSTASLNKLVKVKTGLVPPKSQKRKRNASVMEDEDELRTKRVRKQPKSQPESEEEYSGGESEEDQPSRKHAEDVKTRGIYRDTTRSKKDEPGAQFRAKKAAGDMKRKGAPEPYAYLPLDRKSLKKRGNKDQFKGIIGAARKGAIIGQKLRHRRDKKK